MPHTPFYFLSAMLVAGLTACASSTAQSSQSTVKERTPMTTTTPSNETATSSNAINPQLTPEQMLTGVLELIKTSNSIKDFTPEKLKSTFGVDKLWVKDEGNYGFGERVNQNWGQSFSIYNKESFTLDFLPVDEEANTDMTSLCVIDFEGFIKKMKDMGFSSEPYHAEHGRFISYRLSNGKLNVEVYPRGESNSNAGHYCVQMINVA